MHNKNSVNNIVISLYEEKKKKIYIYIYIYIIPIITQLLNKFFFFLKKKVMSLIKTALHDGEVNHLYPLN